MYRLPIVKVALVRERTVPADVKIITSPADAFAILQPLIGDADREHFVVLMLNTRNAVIGIHTVSTGTLNASLVHPREVFKAALLANTAALILGHNHPSADLSPSVEDVALTKRLRDAGELMGLPVLDHLIIGHDHFISLKERGDL